MTPQDRALVMVYESVKTRLPAGFGLVEYLEASKSFDIIPLTENGAVIGGVLTKGPELHIGYGIKPKSNSLKAYIKSILGVTIEQYGYACTTVMASNKAGLRFCERLGFTQLSEENGTITLRCERGNFL